MDHVQPLDGEQLAFKGGQALIDVARAEGAAEYQQDRGVLRDAERDAAARSVALEHARTDGIAGKDHFGGTSGAGAHDVLGGGLPQRYETRGLGRALVRETRYGVLLVQGNRNPQLRGGAHKGKLEVGTKSDGDIGHGKLARTELLDQAVLFM